MATSVHIPPGLLTAVDRKAQALRISRNRLIVQALEREVAGPSWAPDFFDRLRDVDASVADGVDEMVEGIRANRRSKTPWQP